MKGLHTMAWDFDTSHSTIEFSAKHMMVTNVKGRFNSFSGDAHLDEEHPADSKVDVTIDLASLSTGNEGRDNHLRSADFFDVEQLSRPRPSTAPQLSHAARIACASSAT